jgi:hypothetical protein
LAQVVAPQTLLEEAPQGPEVVLVQAPVQEQELEREREREPMLEQVPVEPL